MKIQRLISVLLSFLLMFPNCINCVKADDCSLVLHFPQNINSGAITAIQTDLAQNADPEKIADPEEVKTTGTPEMADIRNGVASFSNLKPGIWLIVQTEACDGYEPFEPFLVRIDEGIASMINAEPKMEKKTGGSGKDHRTAQTSVRTPSSKTRRPSGGYSSVHTEFWSELSFWMAVLGVSLILSALISRNKKLKKQK